MSDITSYLPDTDKADGTVGSTSPTTAVQVGGSDGTNLRALKTDSSGNFNDPFRQKFYLKTELDKDLKDCIVSIPKEMRNKMDNYILLEYTKKERNTKYKWLIARLKEMKIAEYITVDAIPNPYPIFRSAGVKASTCYLPDGKLEIRKIPDPTPKKESVPY